MPKTKEPPIDTLVLSNGVTIGVFEGKLSEFDIRVKYFDLHGTKQWRQPKHIHWIVDWMLKREHNLDLVKKLVDLFQKIWEENPAEACTRKLSSLFKKEINLKTLYDDISPSLSEFEPLNNNGYYHVDFLIFSGYLLLLQEKNNRSSAYMFQRMFSALGKEYSDLYKVITDATSNYSKK